MEVAGTPFSPYGLYMSLYTTPFGLTTVPPPLFIMPPIIPVLAGPAMILNSAGTASFYALVPPEFSTLGSDLNIYFQGFVQDPVNGIELTNGVRLEIVKSVYKVDVATAYGESLDKITVFGKIQDDNAEDNKVSGVDLLNGAPLTHTSTLPSGHDYNFDTMMPGPATPATSIYLNGMFHLVPGDAGIEDRFNLYPRMGSHPNILTRDMICRNNQNKNSQHIIVPIYDVGGKKTNDLNVYHFRDDTKDEFGFFSVDVLNNSIYELSGTRNINNGIGAVDSAWDPHVAISPDGKYMAAVLRKDRAAGHVDADVLYIIRLRNGDTWYSNEKNAYPVPLDIAAPVTSDFAPTRIYAETMTFAGNPNSHNFLFFACNRVVESTTPTDPEIDESNRASVLWAIDVTTMDTANEEMHYYTFDSLETDYQITTGDNKYKAKYFGSPLNYTTGSSDEYNNLNWIRSADNEKIVMRIAGRSEEFVGAAWEMGEWSWDIISISDIADSFNDWDIFNTTRFAEPVEKEGFLIYPFGSAYNGSARASINPSGTLFAFVAKDYLNTNNSKCKDLYLTATDGSLAGSLVSRTPSHLFKGEFLPSLTTDFGRTIYDPYFASDDDLLFYCGEEEATTVVYSTPSTDLFLFQYLTGKYTNLTVSLTKGSSNPEYEPPFTLFGDVRPAGLFPSKDGKYVFIFRATAQFAECDLVGIDTTDNFRMFDLTGNEFGTGYIPSLATERRKIGFPLYPIGPEWARLVRQYVDDTEMFFFTAMYNHEYMDQKYQVFMVNIDFPVAAFPVTSFSTKGLINNMVVDTTGNFLAFSRSDRIAHDGTEGAYEKIYIVDINHGAYTRDLTPTSNWNMASIDGSFLFIESSGPGKPIEFVYGVGPGGVNNLANNPPASRLWLFPVESLYIPAIPTISYPLTKEGVYLPLSALPFN